jgi:hypothetical protein
VGGSTPGRNVGASACGCAQRVEATVAVAVARAKLGRLHGRRTLSGGVTLLLPGGGNRFELTVVVVKESFAGCDLNWGLE